MSYCVNCGVELDASAQACPLCNTPVINPKEIPYTKKSTPFPKEKGQVELVKRKDLGILMSVVVIATALTCGLLNLLVFNNSPWSVLVIGICVILWVLAVPAVIYTKLPIYVSLLFDGLSVMLYLYLITFMTTSNHWFWGLALPIVILVTVVVELFTFSIRKFPVSFLSTALFLFIAIALICVGIELLIKVFLETSLILTWSAVVLTVCAIICITLITLLSKKRLRNAVRRRLHF